MGTQVRAGRRCGVLDPMIAAVAAACLLSVRCAACPPALLLPHLHGLRVPSAHALQALTRTDIEPALATLKKKLMERNVAEEIADK